MIRVVLDTNIIVSALIQPLGPPAQILLLALGGSVELCVSGSVFAEYEEVIRRPRFRRAEVTLLSTLQAIREQGLWGRSVHAVRACSDPDDDIFLECAQAAQAACLIAGNIKDFPKNWLDTGIVTPRGFPDVLKVSP